MNIAVSSTILSAYITANYNIHTYTGRLAGKDPNPCYLHVAGNVPVGTSRYDQKSRMRAQRKKVSSGFGDGPLVFISSARRHCRLGVGPKLRPRVQRKKVSLTLLSCCGRKASAVDSAIGPSRPRRMSHAGVRAVPAQAVGPGMRAIDGRDADIAI